jgi:hypothetical protein
MAQRLKYPSKLSSILSALQPTIIPLDVPNNSNAVSEPQFSEGFSSLSKPWAPFRTLADFEYAKSAVTGSLSKATVNFQLRGMANSWVEKSNITFRNYDDLMELLTAAREYGVKVCSIAFSFR